MITKFKIFENNNEEISVGDFVLLKINTGMKIYNDFVNNNIGEIINIKTSYNYDTDKYDINKIEVKYVVNKDVFMIMQTCFRYLDYSYTDNMYSFSNFFNVSCVEFYGDSKEDVEIKSNLKKYNL